MPSPIVVLLGVHERLGLPFAQADAAAEYAEEIVASRQLGGSNGSVAGWREYWRFIRAQMNEHDQDVPEMYSYLLAVRDELREGGAASATRHAELFEEEDEEELGSQRLRPRRQQSSDRYGLGSRTMSSQVSRSRMRRGLSPRLRK